MSSWTQYLKDAILENSALRDGLTDDEAQPLINWGMKLAEQVGGQMEQVPADAAENTFEAKKSALLKMLTRITWTAIYRGEKGAAWTLQTLQQVNEFNRSVQGAEAPQLEAAQMQTYAEAQDQMGKGELVRALMHALSTPQSQGAASAAPPADVSPAAPQNPFQQVAGFIRQTVQGQQADNPPDAGVDTAALSRLYRSDAPPTASTAPSSKSSITEDTDNGETTCE